MLNFKLDELGQQLSHCNTQTVQLHTSLSSLSIDSSSVNHILLQLESELFDVACFHYQCQMLLRDKLHLVREREKDLSSLHSDMEILSQSLKSAQELLSQRDKLTNVQEYLNHCKVN